MLGPFTVQESQSADPISDDAQAEIRHFTVTAEQHGERLDKVLALAVPELSRNYLQQLLGQSHLQLNGAVNTKASTKTKVGDQLQIELVPSQASQAYLPEKMAIDWIYQDEHLAVLYKPAGLVVHPGAGNWTGTLLNGLLAEDALAAALPRAGIVHRLDKDTSGLMMIARSREAMEALVRLIAAREVKRQYWALVHGEWRLPNPYTLDAAIGRDPRNRLRMAVVEEGQGKPAQTTMECLAVADSEAISWMNCSLHTGRTHQIRVHMAHLGYALLADGVYRGVAAAGMTRQALHAYRLAFTHPITGEELDFQAALPEDMRLAMENLGFNWGTMP